MAPKKSIILDQNGESNYPCQTNGAIIIVVDVEFWKKYYWEGLGGRRRRRQPAPSILVTLYPQPILHCRTKIREGGGRGGSSSPLLPAALRSLLSRWIIRYEEKYLEKLSHSHSWLDCANQRILKKVGIGSQGTTLVGAVSLKFGPACNINCSIVIYTCKCSNLLPFGPAPNSEETIWSKTTLKLKTWSDFIFSLDNVNKYFNFSNYSCNCCWIYSSTIKFRNCKNIVPFNY